MRHIIRRFAVIAAALGLLWAAIYSRLLVSLVAVAGEQTLQKRDVNPLQVALLRWYEVNQVDNRFLQFQDTRGIAFDGMHMWVAGNGDRVTKLRASDGAILRIIPVSGGASGVTFDGVHIWVSSFSSDRVTKLRASDGGVVGTFRVGQRPDDMAFDGANIWVVNTGSGSVTKLRAQDGVNLGTFNVGPGPRGVAFDGANIWVANGDSDTITKLRR